MTTRGDDRSDSEAALDDPGAASGSRTDPNVGPGHGHVRPGIGPFAKIFLAALIGFLVLGAVAVAFVAGRGVRLVDRAGEVTDEITGEITGEGPFTRIQPVTVQSIKQLSELTTVEYVEFTRVEKGEDRGWLNWVDGDRIELFAVARIGAGVDLAALEDGDIFSDPQTGRVTVRLPEPTITYIAVDNDATHVYNRDTGILTKGDPDLERSARLAAEEVLVTTATERGIMTDAAARAETVVEDLLTSLGYTDIRVTSG